MHRYRSYFVWDYLGRCLGEFHFTPYQVKRAFPFATRIEKGHVYL